MPDHPSQRPSTESIPIGSSIVDRYELRRELGRGAVGSVFLAVDERLERNVAIKFLHPHQQSADDESRFIQEARAAAKLHHPGLCPVYDFGRHGDRLFLVMAYIKGASLFSIIEQKKPRTLTWECNTIQQVSLAMAVAHKSKISHLDLKPENILVQQEDARPIVMDFGLTGLVHTTSTNASSASTHDAGFLGSPAYMSPEQANQQVDRIGPTSDIYSLGVTFYELLTGQLPIRGTLDELLADLRNPNHVCAPVARLRRDVPPAISNLIQRMLSKSIENRPISMQAIAMELQTIAESGAMGPALRQGLERGLGQGREQVQGQGQSIPSSSTVPPSTSAPSVEGFVQPPTLPANHQTLNADHPIPTHASPPQISPAQAAAPKVFTRQRRKRKPKSTWRSLILPTISLLSLIAAAWIFLSPKQGPTAIRLPSVAPESPTPQPILSDKTPIHVSPAVVPAPAIDPVLAVDPAPTQTLGPQPLGRLSPRSGIRETPRDPVVSKHITEATTRWALRPELNQPSPSSQNAQRPDAETNAEFDAESNDTDRMADLIRWNVTPSPAAVHWKLTPDAIQADSRSLDRSILTSPVPMSEFDLTFTRPASASSITNLIWLAEPGFQSTAIAALQISQPGVPIAWKCFANNQVGRATSAQSSTDGSGDGLDWSTLRIEARQDRIMVTVDDRPTSTFEYGNNPDGSPVESSGYLAIEHRVGVMNWRNIELIDRTTDRDILSIRHPSELVPLQQASFWNAKFAQPNCDPVHLLVWKQAPLPNEQAPMMLFGLESSGREVSLVTTTPLMHDYRASVYSAPVQRWLHAAPKSIWLSQGDGTAMTEMFGIEDVTSLAVNAKTTKAMLGTSTSQLLSVGLTESLDFRRGKTLQLPATVSSMRYSADDSIIFAHFRDSRVGMVIDAESGLPIRRFDDVAGLGVFALDSQSVWVPHSSGHLRRWKLDSPDDSLGESGWQTPSLVKALTSRPTKPARLSNRLPGTR